MNRWTLLFLIMGNLVGVILGRYLEERYLPLPPKQHAKQHISSPADPDQEGNSSRLTPLVDGIR